ncbi:MAG: ThiF family adenylyltransferase [Actinobacteria bacterium]|nr:ThiF family adenylyltransferase [Actinomycetota bacterium]
MAGANHDLVLLDLDEYPDTRSLQSWWRSANPEAGALVVTDDRAVWKEELVSLPADVTASLPADEVGSWAVYPWLRAAVAVPGEETLYQILTSRNYPIISRREQRLLHESHAVLIGLSTGRAVAQQLSRLGVGSIHLADGDHLAPSNTNRLVGTRLTDTGLAKVISTARELLEYNPYLKITSQVSFIDGDTLDAHLREYPTAVVIEMIDSLPAKVQIRRVARDHGVPVVTPTSMDWDPMVDIDYPDAPMFGGRLTAEDIAAVENPTTGFAQKTAVTMRLMALPRWAPRSFLSGQLAQSGLVPYWSQTIPAVATGGAAVVRAVFDIVRGQRIPVDRVVLSIRDGFGTADPIDESETLYRQLVDTSGALDLPS